MSFSGDIKDELSRQMNPARHCQIAELSALLSICGSIIITSRNKYWLKINTENQAVARKVFTLVKKTFNIESDISIRRNMSRKSNTYSVIIKRHEDALRILQATKLLEEQECGLDEIHIVNPILIQQTCCKRAFLRGVFLAAGSVSDPTKSYHFEIVCNAEEMAVQMIRLLGIFSIDAKIVPRKKVFVVYVKEGSQIVDILNIMEAHVSLMDMENVRILKEVRNTVNRKVNCETANINKTVSAAMKQIEDITYLKDTIGFGELPKGLKEIASVRLENREASLKELGELLSPPVGKSGVNHRLRKIGELADKVRQERGGLL
ncbi:MAG: DNA-binding protein WhiA [Schaedlerella sp.]|nr:DNA-binding protein WhiA [Schaedlerella sp.]